MSWVCKHIYDVEADLLRFYGMTLDEATESMSGARFFELVARLAYYNGAIASLAEKEHGPQEEEREEVPLGHPSLAGIID